MFSDTGEHEWKIHRSLYFSYINQYFFGTQRARSNMTCINTSCKQMSHFQNVKIASHDQFTVTVIDIRISNG